MPADILAHFQLNQNDCTVTPFGSGLINNTWLVRCPAKRYILQRINTQVFKNPWLIAENIEKIGNYLESAAPQYLFIQPVLTATGNAVLHDETRGWFRLFPFMEGSHTVDVVSSPEQAFEAAVQFGKFTRNLRHYNTASLQISLPHFHDLELRYQQFLCSLSGALPQRMGQAKALIGFLTDQQEIVEQYKKVISDPQFKQRVTHHDAKISNVLFDEQEKGLCVIDLDTVMPGYFISDVGDMMRTYLSPVSEEEKDFSKIEIRDDYFTAIVQGYLQAMHDELTEIEKENFVYAGKFIIYMQALRFATDYLNNDSYYGQKYEGHNYDRAANQVTLLQRLIEKESLLKQVALTLARPAT